MLVNHSFNFNYRKAAQKWHPDNFQGDEKKIAEKKFIDIAAAKEVLTDPGKPYFRLNTEMCFRISTHCV
jgi:curved DNA-binding protein CbpA